MYFLKSLSIKSKLYAGFSALLLVLVGLSGYAVLQFRSIGSDVGKLDTLSSGATAAVMIELNLEKARSSLIRYVYDHYEGARAEFDKVAPETAAMLEKMRKGAQSDRRRQLYGALLDDLSKLQKSAELLEATVKNTDAARARQYTAGDELTAKAAKLVEAAEAEDSDALALQAQRVESALLLVRVAGWRGLAVLDQKGGAIVQKPAADAASAIDALEQADGAQKLHAAIEPVKAALGQYGATAAEVLDGVVKSGSISRNEIIPATTKMQATLDQAVAELNDGVDKAKSSAEQAIGGAVLAQQIVAAATLLLGCLFALAIVRGIVRPLAGLTGGMRELADGNFDVVLPGLDLKNEIGEIAQAVGAFKIKAAEKAQAEADGVTRRQREEAAAQAKVAAERAKAANEQAQAVRRLGEGLKSLAAGDLTVRLDDGFTAAYAQIRDDFNESIDKLKETMLAVVSSAGAIESGTREISSASDDLSRRTEQQAASLEETAAALDEITATVRKSAEGASHARAVAAAADQDVKKSASVVREAVDAMHAIAKSSGQIGQIIGVIDEIAFQTNLLALNAGVEAARAGEAGRGFAVVASEVRALAQRSAEAAKEIKGLISASTTHVDQGVRLVAETGKSLDRIMTQVAEVNGVVAEIAAGAQEQATGLQQVNAAINQMDQVTQQNAAMVEESTAAGHTLSKETSQLSTLIGQFQVGAEAAQPSLKRQLRTAPPHAIPQAAAAPARPRRAAGGGARGGDWEEF